MATVNFSVPQDIKDAFDKTFAGQNKSAVLADLMLQAVDERRRRKRVAKAIDKIIALRKDMRPVSAHTVRATRRQGRP